MAVRSPRRRRSTIVRLVRQGQVLKVSTEQTPPPFEARRLSVRSTTKNRFRSDRTRPFFAFRHMSAVTLHERRRTAATMGTRGTDFDDPKGPFLWQVRWMGTAGPVGRRGMRRVAANRDYSVVVRLRRPVTSGPKRSCCCQIDDDRRI